MPVAPEFYGRLARAQRRQAAAQLLAILAAIILFALSIQWIKTANDAGNARLNKEVSHHAH